MHDIMAMPEIPYEKGAYYIFDRGYNNFSNLFNIEQIEATFVIRAKKELEIQTSFMKTKTSEERFIGLNHRVCRL